ncbi:oxidoreductase [Colletotrichum truncatum]|uniref:Oxidoreductase n=1 Tax=Colletotrichum truncatum TaxID=5467 RepID=A0ACC3Z844_COLTU|nr:oxidoreductase [Colletotrichum truncatum]KAF6783723.1 oxidoreductase [Colletotrichum truncatum]
MISRYVEEHLNPQGVGDARPTALQIIEDEGAVGALSGKAVLITGCSAGIGVETAKAMYRSGATLFLTARDLSKAQTALNDILQSNRVHLLEMHLESLASVRACAANFLSKSRTLNILICNAGMMTPSNLQTQDGFEAHFGINHLAHFLLFNLLQPALEAGATTNFSSRVVMLSSVAHRFSKLNLEDVNCEQNYDGMLAYGASKTANIWMANEVERKYSSRGIHAWSVHPGAVLTELDRNLSEKERAIDHVNPMKQKLAKTLGQGAATTVWAATAKALEGQGGGYLEDVQISKMWEPSNGQFSAGFASYAFDTTKAQALWDISSELIEL